MAQRCCGQHLAAERAHGQWCPASASMVERGLPKVRKRMALDVQDRRAGRPFIEGVPGTVQVFELLRINGNHPWPIRKKR